MLAEPLAHLLTGQPCSSRYPANLRPFAGRFMQEVEPVLMLNANLLFAVLILIAQPHCTAPGEYHILANVRHRVVHVGSLDQRLSTSFRSEERSVGEDGVSKWCLRTSL